MPPRCGTCDKFDSSTGQVWEQFTPRNNYYFVSFLVAYHFGVLPRAGGIDDQDPGTMKIFVTLAEMFRLKERMEDKSLMLKLATIRGGLV